MKNLIFILVFLVPGLSFAKVCKGTYESDYRTLEVDGDGYCSMEADGGIFGGECHQQADGSVIVNLGGNPFSGKFSADCTVLEMSNVTYRRVN